MNIDEKLGFFAIAKLSDLPHCTRSSLYLGVKAAPSSPNLIKCCAESKHNIALAEIKPYYIPKTVGLQLPAVRMC